MSQTVRIYHNPRCSKSRAACALLQEKGITAEVVDYLRTPPSRDELARIVQRLGMRPEEIVRTGEAVYKESYRGRTLSDDEWLDALAAHPILIERPIIIVGDKAVVGRPPERVLELL